MEFRRKIVVFGNHFWDFYNKQPKKVQDKIDYGIDLVKTLEHVPKKYFAKMKGTDGLWEIRVKQSSNIYRIFCFFDKGQLVILLNCFHKKIQKTPKNEIKKAEKLKKEYYERKLGK